MKWLLYILLLLFLVLVTGILTVRFAPGALVSIVNATQSAVQIEASELSTQLYPIRLTSGEATVRGGSFDVVAQDLDLGFEFGQWWNDAPFWRARAAQVDVQTKPDDTPSEEPSTPLNLDLSPLFTFTEVWVEKLSVNGQNLSIRASNDSGNFAAGVSSDAFETNASLSHKQAHVLEASFTSDDLSFTARGELQLGADVQLNIAHATLTTPQVEVHALTGEILCNLEARECRMKALKADAQPTGLEPIAIGLEGAVSAHNDGAKTTFTASLDELTLSGTASFSESIAHFDLQTASPTWPDFLPLVHYPAEALAPIELSVSGNYDESKLQVEAGAITAPSIEATFTGLVDMSQQIQVVAKLQATHISIPLTSAQSGEDGPEQPTPEATDESPLFAAEPIDWSWLDGLQADIEVAADALQIEQAEFEGFALSVTGEDGVLNVPTLSGSFGEGGFSGSALIQREDGGGVATTANFNLDGVALEAFGIVPQEELTGGQTEVVIQLVSRGVSALELAQHASGDILVMVEGAVLQNDLIEVVGSDLLMEALEKLNPFVKDDPTTNLECALVHFEVKDGVLNSNDQLVMETGKMEVVGSGTVNLGSEALKITFSPSSKSGIGVNAGSLVSFLAVGGTIRNPGLTVDALGSLKTGASVGAALSTGGASLLAEGLLKRAINAGSACEAFRKERAPAE